MGLFGSDIKVLFQFLIFLENPIYMPTFIPYAAYIVPLCHALNIVMY